MSHPMSEKKTCTRCGNRTYSRHGFCLDCRAVEGAKDWPQWNRQQRKAVAA